MDETFVSARRAYERARLQQAVARAAWVAPAGLAAFVVGSGPQVAWGMSLGLFAMTAIGGWWRTDLGRGALAGAAVIFIPVLLSGFMQTMGTTMTPSQCIQFCSWGAAGLGGLAGHLLGRTAGWRYQEDGYWFGGAALASSAVAMSVGCTALGFGSLFGLTAGLVAVGLPSFVWAARAEA